MLNATDGSQSQREPSTLVLASNTTAMAQSPSSSRRKIFPCYVKNQQPTKYYTSRVCKRESKQTTGPIQNAELFIKDLWLSIVALVQQVSSSAATALTEEKKCCVRSESVSTESSHSTQQSSSRQEKEMEPEKEKVPFLSSIVPFATKSSISSGPPKSQSLQSILRDTGKYTPAKGAVSSSCVPSLVEESDDDESSQWTRSDQETGDHQHPPASPTGSERCKDTTDTSSSWQARRTKVNFDPRVWIREFQRSRPESESTWYTSEDTDEFVGKKLALERVMRYNQSSRHHIVATGTGRAILQKRRWNGPIYSHAALALDEKSETHMKNRILEQELSSILILDPHDLCRQLLAKTIRRALPKKVSVATASSSEEVLKLLEEGKRFDMILVEERLRLFRPKGAARNGSSPSSLLMSSGSALIRQLSTSPETNRALLIGVSAHLLEDRALMKASGADFCWSKPPPPMDEKLVENLVKTLLLKRNHAALVADLYE